MGSLFRGRAAIVLDIAVDRAPVARHQVTQRLLGCSNAITSSVSRAALPAMSSPFVARAEIRSPTPHLHSAASCPSVGGAARSISVEGRQPTTGDTMPNAPTTNDAARAQDSDRNDVLDAIGAKWSKFSKQELSDLKTNDDLVTQIVDKYGVGKIAAQRDVDALMNGRNLTA